MFLRAENGSDLTEERAREVIEDEFGFGLRSFEVSKKDWKTLTGQEG